MMKFNTGRLKPIHPFPERFDKDDMLILFRAGQQLEHLDSRSFTWMNDHRPISLRQDQSGLLIEFEARGKSRSLLLRLSRLEVDNYDDIYVGLFRYDGYHCLKVFTDFLFYNRSFDIQPFDLTNSVFWNLLLDIHRNYGPTSIGEYSSVAPDGRPKAKVPNEGELQNAGKLFRNLMEYRRILHDITLTEPVDIRLYRQGGLLLNTSYDREVVIDLLTRMVAQVIQDDLKLSAMAATAVNSAMEFQVLADLVKEDQINGFVDELLRGSYDVSLVTVDNTYQITVYDNATNAAFFLKIPFESKPSDKSARSKESLHSAQASLTQRDTIAETSVFILATQSASNLFIRDMINRASLFLGRGGKVD